VTESPVAAALAKAKSKDDEVEEEEDEKEPSLADILSSITEILSKLTSRQKGPLIETHIRDLV
jgi:hypothetical protein